MNKSPMAKRLGSQAAGASVSLNTQQTEQEDAFDVIPGPVVKLQEKELVDTRTKILEVKQSPTAITAMVGATALKPIKVCLTTYTTIGTYTSGTTVTTTSRMSPVAAIAWASYSSLYSEVKINRIKVTLMARSLAADANYVSTALTYDPTGLHTPTSLSEAFLINNFKWFIPTSTYVMLNYSIKPRPRYDTGTVATHPVTVPEWQQCKEVTDGYVSWGNFNLTQSAITASVRDIGVLVEYYLEFRTRY